MSRRTSIGTALAVAALTAGALAAGCGGKSSTSPALPSRRFAMGFTDFPSAATLAAVQDAKRVIAEDGDLVVYHLDGGIPWQEEAAGLPYAANFEYQLVGQQAFHPAGHALYLAVTPISGMRDGLALHVGASTSEPLVAPWDTLAFDDPQVIRTYGSYCEHMIQRFHPDWFAYAIEANLLAQKSPAKWPAFMTLAESTYASLKRAHPALPVFATIQVETLYGDLSNNGPAVQQLLGASDVVAVSTYPYAAGADPATQPADYWTGVAALAPGKPFAVAETGWPAQPVTAPYPVNLPGSPQLQQAYVSRLLGDLDRTDTRFVNWFLGRDYDSLWVAQLQYSPDAYLLRLWKDMGLYDSVRVARPALATWRETLRRPRR